MHNETINPVIVGELYKQLNDKQVFISMYSTTEFDSVPYELLRSMYQFLMFKLT